MAMRIMIAAVMLVNCSVPMYTPWQCVCGVSTERTRHEKRCACACRGVDEARHERLGHLDEGDGEVQVGAVGEPEGRGVERADGHDAAHVVAPRHVHALHHLQHAHRHERNGAAEGHVPAGAAEARAMLNEARASVRRQPSRPRCARAAPPLRSVHVRTHAARPACGVSRPRRQAARAVAAAGRGRSRHRALRGLRRRHCLTHIVSASGKGKPEYASSHLLNRMTDMLRGRRAAGATRQAGK